MAKQAMKIQENSTWTQEKLEAFGAEIDSIGEEIKAKLGPKDVAYAKKVRRLSKACEIAGRTLIHVSFDPFTWSAGVFSLWIHNQLETIEIGHSALHGSWDGLAGAEVFYSEGFRWKAPVPEDGWKREHNILHHQYTNIIGRDPDLNYGTLRVAPQVSWFPFHMIQVSQFFWTAPIFLWVIGLYSTGLTDLMTSGKDETYASILPDKSPRTILKAVTKTAKKLIPYSLYNFGLWPLLAGPFWWKVLAGNLTADAMRNIYSIATIYAGHFGDDLKYFDKDYRPKGRGEWYKMQIEAAHDYDVPKPLSLLCGALDYQIEHHLFPKMPPNRLREIQPKIQDICRRYGVQYKREKWGVNLKAALKRLVDMGVPPNGWKDVVGLIPFVGQRLQTA